MDIRSTVVSLSEISGTSGSESKVAQLALGMLREYCPDAEIINGNVTGKFGTHREDFSFGG